MNNTLKLDEARQRTPAVSGVEAMRQQLQVSLFGALKESDMEKLAGMLRDRALAGDMAATKLLLQLVGAGKGQPAPAPTAAPQKVQVAVVVERRGKKQRVIEAREGNSGTTDREDVERRKREERMLKGPPPAEEPDEREEARRGRAAQLARHLDQAGPRTLAELAADGWPRDSVTDLLVARWFELEADGYRVTPAGRSVLLGARNEGPTNGEACHAGDE